MAEAAGHKFGQAIGDYCEAAIGPLLADFAKKHGLYLDKKGVRPARKGKKLRWVDKYGSHHDLDFVLERGGTARKIGTPVAFIESAWRRYTKHSRNKAQEIQGALLPIRELHQFSKPFLGCVLVGEYTPPAIGQLENLGFHVLYFQYDTVIQAFKVVGVDVSYDEKTPDDVIRGKHRDWEAVSDKRKLLVWEKLVELNASGDRGVRGFMESLEKAVARQIVAVRVTPLHGVDTDFVTIQQAVEFVVAYDEFRESGPLVRYEIQIRYNNGDKINAEFQEKGTTIDFLKAYLSGNWTPAEGENVPGVDDAGKSLA